MVGLAPFQRVLIPALLPILLLSTGGLVVVVRVNGRCLFLSGAWGNRRCFARARRGQNPIMSQPPNPPERPAPADDEATPAADDGSRWVDAPGQEVEIVEVTTTDTQPVADDLVTSVPYPAGELEEVGPAVVTERERVQVEEDGSVSRRLDRIEQPPVRRRRPQSLVPALLIILALALGAIAAAWYFTQSDSSSVPAVEGLVLNDAVSRVEDEGFRADIINEPNDAQAGTVFRQNPSAGTDLEEGSSVQLFSSEGPADVTIPNAVGVTETEARDRLAAVGLTANVVKVFSDDAPTNQVIAQSPAAGSQAAKGSAVRLNVSKGSGLTAVPSVVGMTQSDAEAQLDAAGLKANVVSVPSQEASGTVVAQNPTSGQARQGSAVRLNVSQGP